METGAVVIYAQNYCVPVRPPSNARTRNRSVHHILAAPLEWVALTHKDRAYQSQQPGSASTHKQCKYQTKCQVMRAYLHYVMGIFAQSQTTLLSNKISWEGPSWATKFALRGPPQKADALCRPRTINGVLNRKPKSRKVATRI